MTQGFKGERFLFFHADPEDGNFMHLVPPDPQEIRYRVSRIQELPPLIGALARFLEIIYDDVGSRGELEDLIEYDPALSARTLCHANSSYYGMRGNVNSIAQAIETIGFEQAKSLCVCTLLMQLYVDKEVLEGEERELLWKHNFTTARMAREIARRRPWISGEKAYALGILHDLGRLAMAMYLTDHYKFISTQARSRSVPLWFVESEYGLTHTSIGKWVAVKWAYPEVVQRVIEFHHTPYGSPSFKSEVRLIFLANALANSKEYPEYLTDGLTLSCLRDLYIPEKEWQHHVEESEEVWHQAEALWALFK
jgi:HD-like signal output (HDOD) protein